MRQRAASRVHSSHEDNVSTTVIRQSDLPAKLRQTGFAKQFSNSLSPGAAASELGYTRQAIHQLIKAGRLDAIRIVSDSKPHKLFALLITQESFDLYRRLRDQKQTA